MATIDQVSLDIAVVLGSTDMPVHQVLRLGRGAMIELDATEEDEIQILANNFPVARGIVVVQGDRIAVEVKELLPRAADARCTERLPDASKSLKILGSCTASGRFVTSPGNPTPSDRRHSKCGHGGIGRRTSLRC